MARLCLFFKGGFQRFDNGGNNAQLLRAASLDGPGQLPKMQIVGIVQTVIQEEVRGGFQLIGNRN